MEQTQTAITRRMLPVKLTEYEINRAAMSSAQYAQQYQEVEDEKKDVTSALGDRLKSLRGAIKDRSEAATSGQEVRPVDCEWSIFREDGKKRLYRLDTGEMIEEQSLTPAEMQSSLGL